jgi:hypothetical protein
MTRLRRKFHNTIEFLLLSAQYKRKKKKAVSLIDTHTHTHTHTHTCIAEVIPRVNLLTLKLI